MIDTKAMDALATFKLPEGSGNTIALVIGDLEMVTAREIPKIETAADHDNFCGEVVQETCVMTAIECLIEREISTIVIVSAFLAKVGLMLETFDPTAWRFEGSWLVD